MRFTSILASIMVLSSFVLAMPIRQDTGARDDFDAIQDREYSDTLDARDYLDFGDTLIEREYSDLDARDYLDFGDALIEREYSDLEARYANTSVNHAKCLSRCQGLGSLAKESCVAKCHKLK